MAAADASPRACGVAFALTVAGAPKAGKSWILRELEARDRLLSQTGASDANLSCFVARPTLITECLRLFNVANLPEPLSLSDGLEHLDQGNPVHLTMLLYLPAACNVTIVVDRNERMIPLCVDMALELATYPAGLLVLVQNNCTPQIRDTMTCMAWFDPEITTEHASEMFEREWAELCAVYERVVFLRIPHSEWQYSNPALAPVTRKARAAASATTERMVVDGPAIAKRQLDWLAELLRAERSKSAL